MIELLHRILSIIEANARVLAGNRIMGRYFNQPSKQETSTKEIT